MVKYHKLNIAVNGKSNLKTFLESLGRRLKARMLCDSVKVRPGATFSLK